MENITIEKMTKEELVAKLQVILIKMNETEDNADYHDSTRELYEEAQALISDYFEGIGWSYASIGRDEETAYVDWENGKELREFDDYYDECDGDDTRAHKEAREEDTVLLGIITVFEYGCYPKKIEMIIEKIDKWEVETFYAVWSNGQTNVYTLDEYGCYFDRY